MIAAARTTPSRARGGFLWRMPRWLRIVITAYCFAMFFGGTMMAGSIVAILQLVRKSTPDRRKRFTRQLNRALALFSLFMRDVGLIDYWPADLPARYVDRPFLLIANHPTLIDVVLLMGSLQELSCVVKASWYRSFLMGPMLRRTEYVPGPGHDEESEEDAPALHRIEAKLREGVPVLVFPEGTRSHPDRLRRFRRGAIEAAIRAGVPILPIFIANDQPWLSKGTPISHAPRTTVRFDFEWMDAIETADRTIESKELTREIAARYEERFASLLEARALSSR